MDKKTETQKETYSVRLTPSIVKEIKLLCVHQGRTFSDILEESLKDTLKKHGKKALGKKGKS